MELELNTNKSNINLKDLLEYLGEDVIPHGRTSFKLKEHDSLIITYNKFFWNSKGVGGNYYTLLKELYGLDKKRIFDTVEQFISDVNKGIYKPLELNNCTHFEKEKKDKSIWKRQNLSKIKEYLAEKRGIDNSIVESLYLSDLVTMDFRNNIYFKIRDKNLNYVGNELIGTDENNKFRQNMTDKGFNITISTEDLNSIKKLYVFEASIDLISYIEMNRENINKQYMEDKENVRFLSLSGLKDGILSNYMENIQILNICVDNDSAGDKFYNRIKETYKDIKVNRETPKNKDWNDDLRESKHIYFNKIQKIESENKNEEVDFSWKKKECEIER